jgi:prophage regulatory protein
MRIVNFSSPASSGTVAQVSISNLKVSTMRFLSRPELDSEKGIKFSRQHLMRLINAGKFPRPVKLGGNPLGGNSWLESEIDEYLERCLAERDAKGSAAA